MLAGEKRLENRQETEDRQTDMELEHHAMHLIRDRISIRTGDRARVRTDREAVAMTAETEIVRATKEVTKIEGAQTGATKVQTDSRDRRLGIIPDSLDQSRETEIKNKVDRVSTDKEVQVVTDSTIVAAMTEMIRTEATVSTEIGIEAMTADRAGQQKETSRIEIVETTAETAVTTETGATTKAETSIVAETKIEAEMTAEIGDLATTDSAQIRQTDLRKTYRDRKIGMTRIGTEEITVQGHTIRTKRRTVGNV